MLCRFGLLPVILGYTITDLMRLLPLTFDLTVWYGHVTLLTLFVTVGVAVWGFRAALAGRPLFRDEILGAEAEVRQGSAGLGRANAPVHVGAAPQDHRAPLQRGPHRPTPPDDPR